MKRLFFTVVSIFFALSVMADVYLTGTYQQHDMPLFKENMTDPQKIGVDFYIATCTTASPQQVSGWESV